MAKRLAKSFSFWEPDIDRTDSEELAKKSRAKNKYALGKVVAHKIKHLSYHRQQIKSFEDVARLPVPGECYELFTQKQLNAFTLILAVLKYETRIDALYVTTFNMNELTLLSILDMFDTGVIGELAFCISESVRFRMPKRFAQIEKAFTDRRATGRFRVAITWNHSKVCLISCGENRYVIRGSGNFSDNAEIEEYCFYNNSDSYDHIRDNVLEAYIFKNSKGLKRHEVWTGGNGEKTQDYAI